MLPGQMRATFDPLAACTLTLVETRSSGDGTTKLLLLGRDGLPVETVIMRYSQRATVCISSQCGCPVGCSFCATGAMGLRRNLAAAEMVDQVRAAAALVGEEGRRVSNVVYMGMGEPLLNLGPVLDSVRILTHPLGQGLAHRSLSISTIGIPRGILRLARTEPQVNLAVSLHAPDDRTRALLVPETYRHSVGEILDAAWQHFDLTHRKLLVEYVLIEGVNDSADHARRLAGLLRGHVVTVNLMAWNQTLPSVRANGEQSTRPQSTRPRAEPQTEPQTYLPNSVTASGQSRRLRSSSPAAIAAFKDVLVAAHIETVVRRSKGAGIQAACGQLAGRALPRPD
jgi:adenine C2-methylase RlmN of 23S rRNA A2503 and tRNA A37